LLQHDAGEIVYTFGQFAVAGNLAVGIVVFSIITIVQFIVITKGSERVAEVSARFSLDGMPGKQMSIDGDMRAGTIDANEARRQRRIVQKESQLYGAMDGAMKFVKGDAIASIIITLVNILGGITVGVLMHNMSASEAANTYGILSIGDGLIAQIPSLLISVTAGIIVTRVPGEQKKNLAAEVSEQLDRYPQALSISAIVLLIFALIPGFPTFDFLFLAGIIGFYLWHKHRRNKSTQHVGYGSADNDQASMSASAGNLNLSPGAIPLKLVLASNLYHRYQTLLIAKLDQLRQQKFEQLGIPLSEILIEMNHNLADNTLQVLLYQEPVLTINIPDGLILLDNRSPQVSYATQVDMQGLSGMSLQWVDSSYLEMLATLGIISYQEEERLIYCMSLIIDRYANEFVGVQETRFLMDAMEARHAELVKELQRQLPVGKISNVLQRLTEENISIRDLRSIFEALIEWAPKEKDLVMLTEYTRLGLRRHIIERHRYGQPWIVGWMVGAAIENMIRESIRQTSAGSYSTLDPAHSKTIVTAIYEHINSQSQSCVLLATMDIRRFVRKLIERDLFHVPVLSYQEIGDEAQLKILGNIELINIDEE
jgi:type III secretion protein V